MATKLLVVSGNGLATAVSLDDGASWAHGTLPAAPGRPAGGTYWRPAVGGPAFVAITDSSMFNLPAGVAAHSADGLTWYATSMPSAQHWSRPVWTGEKYVSIGQTSVATSETGATWSESPLGFTLPYGEASKMAGTGGNLVAVGPYTTHITTSSDGGATWQRRPDLVRDSEYEVIDVFLRGADVVIAHADWTHMFLTVVTFPYTAHPSVIVSTIYSQRVMAVVDNGARTLLVGELGLRWTDSVSGPLPALSAPIPHVRFSNSSPYLSDWRSRSVTWNGNRFVGLSADSHAAAPVLQHSVDGSEWSQTTPAESGAGVAVDWGYLLAVPPLLLATPPIIPAFWTNRIKTTETI